MKYIRTKDGVYEVSHLNAYATHKRKGETLLEGYKTSYIKNENIIAQSENLAELCDGFYIDIEFYVEHFSNCEYAFHHFEMFVKTMKSFKTNNKVMVKKLNGGFGYIRTNKGLLYVAKLNDKGELELI